MFVVKHRVQEELERDRWPVRVAVVEREPGCQPATGTAATDGNAAWVHVEFVRVFR